MGEVFAAVIVDPSIVHDEGIAPGRRVAVKVVSRQVIGEVLMARLQREAIAAVRVKSDFVPRVLDVDTTEEGEVFLVMELLRGQTLAERLRRRGGTLTWEEVSGIGEDVLQGLIDAHAAGVIHRDLKPSNIFIESRRGPALRERAKILDFGVCKLDAPDEEKLTTTGESVGTVAYMAPEQVRGASRVNERADLYSFVSVIFETLAGRLAHDGPGQMAMLASKLERPAMHLAQAARVAFPPALDALLAKMLSRNPSDRPASALAVLELWKELGPPTMEAVTLAILPIDVEQSPSADPSPATDTGVTSGTMTRMGKKASKLGAVLGVTAVAATGTALVLMLGARGPSTASASATPEREGQVVQAVSSSTSEPAVESPAASETASVPTVAIPELDTTRPDAPDASVSPPTAKPARYARPVRPGTKRAPSSEPHISDKPRY
jgi:eukaryotic-like serine/threonine-protein kinase